MNEIKVEISAEVKSILEKGAVDGCLYFLPQIQLNRDEYVAVNKILELLGGKWNRSKKAHIFENEQKASSVLGSLDVGSVVDKKKTYQFFETPKDLAKRMVELADIKYTDNEMQMQDVIEPSAGRGAICDEIDQSKCLFRCTELNPENAEILIQKGYPVFIGDFLESTEEADRFIMNPPFTKGQDAQHVAHAYSLLRKGGRLVSVMSASVKFNQQKKYAKVRELIEKNGEIIEIAPKTFKESGTNVNTVLIVLNKP